jgi:hypothetical protein
MGRRIAVEGVPRHRVRARGAEHARARADAEKAVLARLADGDARAVARTVNGCGAEAFRELAHDAVESPLLAEAAEVAVGSIDPVEEAVGPLGVLPPAVGEVLLRLHRVRDPQDPGAVLDEVGRPPDDVDEHLVQRRLPAGRPSPPAW